MNVAVEFFDNEITDSPIVSEDYVVKGFLAVNYVFYQATLIADLLKRGA
jgi:outer membrane protein